MADISSIDDTAMSVSTDSLTLEQVEAAVMLTWWECRQRFNTVDVHEAPLARTHFIWPSGLPNYWIDSLASPQGYRDCQNHPEMRALIEELYTEINQGTYRPALLTDDSQTLTMVKSPSLSVRSVAIKSFRDCIVLNLALIECYGIIYARLSDSLKQGCHCWQQLSPEVIVNIDSLSEFPVGALVKANYTPLDRSLVGLDKAIVELDLFRAYELADIVTLAERLRQWGCSHQAIHLMSEICQAYSLNGRTGLPISALASMVFFDVLLYPIDQQLGQWGWLVSRHSTDTYEVVVPENMSLPQAAEKLYRLFARHGMYINDAKTHVRLPQHHSAMSSVSALYRKAFQVTQWVNHTNAWVKIDGLFYGLSALPGGKRWYQDFLSDWLMYDPYQALPRVCQHLQQSPRFWLTLHPVLERYMTTPDNTLEMGKLTAWTCMTRISHQWQQHPLGVPVHVSEQLSAWLKTHTHQGGPA